MTGDRITKYEEAVGAIESILQDAEVNVDKDAIKVHFWEDKIVKLQKEKQKKKELLNSARRSLQELVSIEVATDIIDSLYPVNNNPISKVTSTFKKDAELRKKRVPKEALAKLKRIGFKNLTVKETIQKQGRDFTHLRENDLYFSPESVVESVETGIDALDSFSAEFYQKRLADNLEMLRDPYHPSKELITLTARALEVVVMIDEIIQEYDLACERRIPLEERKFVFSQDDKNQALEIKKDLTEYIKLIDELKDCYESIRAIEYNIKALRDGKSLIRSLEPGYSILEELEKEHSILLKNTQARVKQLEDLRQGYGKSAVLTRCKNILDFLSFSNYQFDDELARFQNFKEEDKKTPEEKKRLVLKAIADTGRARTIYEEYLREVAGQGKDRIPFSEYAAKHNLPEAYVEYERSLLEEQVTPEEDKSKELRRW